MPEQNGKNYSGRVNGSVFLDHRGKKIGTIENDNSGRKKVQSDLGITYIGKPQIPIRYTFGPITRPKQGAHNGIITPALRLNTNRDRPLTAFRNAQADAIVKCASKTDFAKAHQPLDRVLATHQIKLNTVLDYIGGSGRHAEYLQKKYDCNVMMADPSGNLVVDFGDRHHLNNTREKWLKAYICPVTNPAKIQEKAKDFVEQGRMISEKFDMIMIKDGMHYIPEPERASFVQTISDMVEEGGLIDASASTVPIKHEDSLYKHCTWPVKNTAELQDMFKGFIPLYLAEEKRCNESEEKTIHGIFMKPKEGANPFDTWFAGFQEWSDVQNPVIAFIPKNPLQPK